MSYLNEDFLLSNKTAQRLYHDVAAHQPIFDYHTHLSPQAIAENAGFGNLADIWLEGDHYKWRAMRAAGVPEELVTNLDADPKERFMAWARTIPQAVRNPLHHWTHLELKHYFDCDLVLSESTADAIWEIANAKLSEDAFRTQNILKDFKIYGIGTTDCPLDKLEHHRAFAQSDHPTKLCPTFRPDGAMMTAELQAWNQWADKLAALTGNQVNNANEYLDALKQRHDYFHANGGRFSDHDVNHFPYAACSDKEANTIFNKLRAEEALSAHEDEQWRTYILQNVARWNAAKGWAMQFHIGVIRRPNTRIREKLGADTGHDAMYDDSIITKMAPFLDSLDQEEALPKCVFYHVNPAALYPIAVMMGAFQDGKIAGKMQLGSGWWHLDTLHGMQNQMDTLSSVGLFPRFIGMLTDSRSFLSFPRHEYFRRLLCNIVGNDVATGLIPDDNELTDQLVKDICFNNAKNYFNI
ncbi:MAG: glucuronate isomerase [Lentimonas sp.]